MKFKNFMYFVMVVLLIAVSAACSEQGTSDESADSVDTSQDTNSEVSNTESSEASEEEPPSDSGELGDCTVSILNHELTEDYEGNPAIRVYYDFTNNGEEATSFMFAVSTTAFQNGIELKSAVCIDDVDEDDNNLKDIKPGATLKCAKIYVLDDTSSPVEIEATELISWDGKMLTKTFDIAE